MRLLVVLLLWQGPIPWIHNHSAAHASVAFIDFNQHLRDFHGRDLIGRDFGDWPESNTDSEICSCNSYQEFGWHFHFSFPDKYPGNEERPECKMFAEREFVDSRDSLEFHTIDFGHVGSWDNWHYARPALKLELGFTESSSQFFGTYATKLSLPQRFCVHRC